MEFDTNVIVDAHGKPLILQKIVKTVDTEYGGNIEETITETEIIGILEEISMMEKLLVYGQMTTTVIRGYFKRSDSVVLGDRIKDGNIVYEVDHIIRYDPYIEAELKKFSG